MAYKCDICGKPATVHITKIVNGKKVKLHLCAECAQKASSMDGFADKIVPKLKEFEEQIAKSEAKVVAGKCPSCGANLAEMEKGALFSCPECYAALGEKLFQLLERRQGATEHKGKTPAHHAYKKLDTPKTLLDEAIEKVEEVIGSEIFAHIDAHVSDANPAQMPASPALQQKAAKGATQTPSAQSKQETVAALKKELEIAVQQERYEDAAIIRDKLNALDK